MNIIRLVVESDIPYIKCTYNIYINICMIGNDYNPYMIDRGK